MRIEKWYRFDAGPIAHWGLAMEEQAKAYCEMRARRYPDATYAEVDGEPKDGTIVNVVAALTAAGIEVVPAPLMPANIFRTPRNDSDFVGVATPTLVYVIVKDRAGFDKIGAPLEDLGMRDTGHVLVKTVGKIGEPMVIFQHWLVSRDYVAERVAEMQRKESASA